MNVNFGVDHRYIDGGKAKKFMSAFRSVFEDPRSFLKSPNKMEEKK